MILERSHLIARCRLDLADRRYGLPPALFICPEINAYSALPTEASASIRYQDQQKPLSSIRGLHFALLE